MSDLQQKNKRSALIITAIVAAMIGLSFASVPLYRLFCQVTGFGGTPNIDPNATPDRILEREITVRLNADVVSDMPWTFRPETKSVKLKIGQKGMVSFYARNETSVPIEGTAIFNVLPENAAPYFHKTQCFCFGRQRLDPKGEAHMPVVFFVDPKMTEDPDLKNLQTITLSYTFFKADSPELEKALDAFYQNAP